MFNLLLSLLFCLFLSSGFSETCVAIPPQTMTDRTLTQDFSDNTFCVSVNTSSTVNITISAYTYVKSDMCFSYPSDPFEPPKTCDQVLTPSEYSGTYTTTVSTSVISEGDYMFAVASRDPVPKYDAVMRVFVSLNGDTDVGAVRDDRRMVLERR